MTLEEIKSVYANPCMCVDVTDSGGTKHHMKCNRCFSIHNYFPALIRIIEAQREALKMVTLVAANQPDENLMDATGPRGAKHRGIMVCNARDIAREALTLADKPLEATT